MPSQRIVPAPDFETRIAQAGFSKASLASAAGVSRLVIFRAINPKAYNVNGTLTERVAWALAQAYAERSGTDQTTAFNLLFRRVERQDQDATPPPPDDNTRSVPPAASLHEPERAAPDLPSRSTPAADSMPPAIQEQPERLDSGPKQTIGLRVDAETLRMLDALVQDEDRASRSDMIRLLIRRAYRVRGVREPPSPGSPPEAPITDRD